MRNFLLFTAFLIMTSTLIADVNKGKRYYMKEFKQKFKMDGLDFVQLHTQSEWRALFDNEGRGFIVEFSQKYPHQATYLNDPKTWKKLQHVRDFAIEYASDSGKVPSCGDTGPAEEPVDLDVKESSSANFF